MVLTQFHGAGSRQNKCSILAARYWIDLIAKQSVERGAACLQERRKPFDWAQASRRWRQE